MNDNDEVLEWYDYLMIDLELMAENCLGADHWNFGDWAYGSESKRLRNFIDKDLEEILNI